MRWARSMRIMAALASCLAWEAVKLGPLAAAEPASEASGAAVEMLIEQLGDQDFFVRDRAQEELIRRGFEAFDALTAAEQHDDIEIAARAQYLVRRLRIDWSVEGDSPAVQSILESYETSDELRRRAAIRRLASLAPDEGVSALCRLVRFESSQLRSKHAAIAVIGQDPTASADLAARDALILRTIGKSSRPGAEWLRAYVASRTSDDASAVDRWQELIDEEQQVLDEFPQRSDAAVVSALVRWQADLLRDRNRADDALAAMRRLVDLERGEKESLTDLIAWLSERHAWSVVDELADRFESRVERQPLVLYYLARARQSQGKAEEAERLAERARKLNPDQAEQHLIIAFELLQRAMRRWSEQELRLVIEFGEPTDLYALRAKSWLGEMLHDQGEDQAAADLLGEAVTAIEENTNPQNQRLAQHADLDALRARMFYFRWLHESAEDAEGARPLLDQAIEADPTDADVLIALYQQTADDPRTRGEVMELIRGAADLFRQQIDQLQDDAQRSAPYNQLAWLVANTEGDLDEALECSQKSLELRPDSAGYLDTLAHCYFARGDFASAVKYETLAVKLDPDSGLMNKQLNVFREALAESTGAAP